MEIDISKLKPAVIPVSWDALSAVVLKDEKEVLIVRTPSDDREELADVAAALDEVLPDGTPYLAVPYSVELLTFKVREGWFRRMWRKMAVICRGIIDSIRRARRRSK